MRTWCCSLEFIWEVSGREGGGGGSGGGGRDGGDDGGGGGEGSGGESEKVVIVVMIFAMVVVMVVVVVKMMGAAVVVKVVVGGGLLNPFQPSFFSSRFIASSSFSLSLLFSVLLLCLSFYSFSISFPFSFILFRLVLKYLHLVHLPLPQGPSCIVQELPSVARLTSCRLLCSYVLTFISSSSSSSRDKVVTFLEDYGLINNSQFGFRNKRSCLTNLLDFFNYVYNVYDDCRSVDIIYFDFQKAFDKVPHMRLFTKLKAHYLYLYYHCLYCF